jgi:hypothetical protein
MLRGEERTPSFTPVEYAQRAGEERISGLKPAFEQEYGPIAEDVIRSRYNELMDIKARELGMVYDPVQRIWLYTDESQRESFLDYQIEAQAEAFSQGQIYYQRAWEDYDFEARAENILREEYWKRDYVLVEKSEGGFDVVERDVFNRQQRMISEKQGIRERMTGSPEERVGELGRFVSLSVLHPVSFLGDVAYKSLTGDVEGALDVYAQKTMEMRGKDIVETIKGSYLDPFGLGGLSLIYGGSQLLSGGLGLVKGAGGKILQKGVPVAVGGGFATIAGSSIGITAAIEEPFTPEKGFMPLFTGESGKQIFQLGVAASIFAGFSRFGPTEKIFGKEITQYTDTGIVTEQPYIRIGGKQIGLPFYKQLQIINEYGLVPYSKPVFQTPMQQIPKPYVGFAIPEIIKPSKGVGTVEVKESSLYKTTFIEKGFGKYAIMNIIDDVLLPRIEVKSPAREFTIELQKKDITMPRIEISDKKGKSFIPDTFRKTSTDIIGSDFQEDKLIYEIYGKKTKSLLPPKIIEKPMLGEKPKPLDVKISDTYLPKSIKPEFRNVLTLMQVKSMLPTRSLQFKTAPVKSRMETLPSIDISVKADPKFIRKLITEEGATLEYNLQDVDITTKVYGGKSLIPEKIVKTGGESLQGVGNIFKPTIPGEYVFSPKMGRFVGASDVSVMDVSGKQVKPISIGEQAAVDLFTGRLGVEPMVGVGKLVIPEKISDVKGGVSLSNINREWYVYQSSVKLKTSSIGDIIGLGKTYPEYGYKVKGYFRGYEIEAKPYRTIGKLTLGDRSISIHGKGTIYDLTEAWKGGTISDVSKTSIYELFTQKSIPVGVQSLGVKIAESVLKSDVLSDSVKQSQSDFVSVGKAVKLESGKTINMESFDKQLSQDYQMKSVSESAKQNAMEQTTRQGVKLIDKQINEQVTKQNTKLSSKNLSKTITENITRQVSKPMTDVVTEVLNRQINKTLSEEITKTSSRIETKLASKVVLKSVTKLMDKLVVESVATTPTVVKALPEINTLNIFKDKINEVIVAPPGIGAIGIMEEEVITAAFVEPVYRAEVLKRQYMNGKRIRGRVWVSVDDKVYRRNDALAVASHKVDNTAKRSIRLVEAKGKPSKKPSHVRGWGLQQFEYNQRSENVFVEKNMFAIDSPGEIKEITMRGINARRNNKSRRRLI